jgi:hypothetical protein
MIADPMSPAGTGAGTEAWLRLSAGADRKRAAGLPWPARAAAL